MPPILADYLKHLKVTKSHCGKGFVAPGLKGEMLDYGVLYRGVQRLCEEAGVSVVSPHLLRHSSTEIYVRFGGATMEDIRRLLHHKSVETTKRYMHRTDERTQELAAKVSDCVSSILNADKSFLKVV